MNNELTIRKQQALSRSMQTAIQNWREQPTQYYSMLSTATPRKMIEADTPTLWDLCRELGRAATIAILVKAFIHTARLVNLDKNLTQEQIGEAANDILESHGQLKVEEVKFLLKRALRTQNVYGRLDYNVLMNWVEQYDAERTEEAMRISDQRESQAINTPTECPDAVSFDAYISDLRERAKTDEEAAALLKEIEIPSPTRLTLTMSKNREQDEHDFKLYRFKYLLGK